METQTIFKAIFYFLIAGLFEIGGGDLIWLWIREGKPLSYAVLEGLTYIREPPSVTFKAHGKLITADYRKIAVNALKNDIKTRKIVEWMKRAINKTEENHVKSNCALHHLWI